MATNVNNTLGNSVIRPNQLTAGGSTIPISKPSVNPFDDQDDQHDMAATPTVNIYPSMESDDDLEDMIDRSKNLEDDLSAYSNKPKDRSDTGSADGDQQDNKQISENFSLDALAARLLKEKFILTALELHMELIESGRELSRLRDFFSNPANFERARLAVAENSPPRTLARTSSVQTFDSLDFARYSDDGERNENDRVAVLEFEIRKAQDTIKGLRDALTRSAEQDFTLHQDRSGQEEGVVSSRHRGSVLGTPDDSHYVIDEPMRPYERKTINFLVNEHLLRCNYKLTSVTFSEENKEQDFDDWDDVGINVAKPPDLLRLYRDYGQHQPAIVDKCDAECLTDDYLIQDLVTENKRRDSIPGSDEERNDGSDCERNSLMESSVTVDSCSSEEHGRVRKSSASTLVGDTSTEIRVVDGNVDDSVVIEDCKEEIVQPSENYNDIIPNSENHNEMKVNEEINEKSTGNELLCREINTESFQSTNRSTPLVFQQALLAAALRGGSTNQQIELTTDESGLISALSQCLPRVIPNVLLARRDELIPLLVLAATLHSDASVRDAMLHELFNLIKRPDTDQRRAILSGCVVFARHAGAARVSSELLPQCWEQIEHKYAERRLLVAEACGTLAPFIPNDMRGSLVLSILQQMLGDKMEDVRVAVVRSLGALVGWVDDTDKYPITSGLLSGCLSDSSEQVVEAVLNVLLPSVALWSIELGRLESHLIHSILENIDRLLKTGVMLNASPVNAMGTNQNCVVADVKRFEMYVTTLQQLVPFLFISVVTTGPFSQSSGSGDQLNEELLRVRPEPVSDLVNLSVICGSKERLLELVSAYESFISEEWYELWESLSWTSAEFIPRLMEMTTQLDPVESIVRPVSRLFGIICRTFGHTFTSTKILPRFHQALGVGASDSKTIKISSPPCPALLRATAPVFIAGVLTCFCSTESERQYMQALLTEFLRVMSASSRRPDSPPDPTSLRGVASSDLASLSSSFVRLCALDVHYHEMVLRVLWDAVMDSNPGLRSTAGQLMDCVLRGGGFSEQIIANRVVPALVTLASDADITVRVSAVSALGTIVEISTDRGILEKVYMQFQTFMDDPVYRSTGEQYSLYLEIIRTFGRIGPNTEPRFRDEFILPRLTALAAENEHTSNERRKAAVALELFETFSALSCCFVSDQLIQEVMLPGLRCILRDFQLVALDHVNVVSSMIKEFENRIASELHHKPGTDTGSTASSEAEHSTGDAVKSKMMSRIRDVKDRAAHANLTKMFSAGKK